MHAINPGIADEEIVMPHCNPDSVIPAAETAAGHNGTVRHILHKSGRAIFKVGKDTLPSVPPRDVGAFDAHIGKKEIADVCRPIKWPSPL